jgi:Holliday junction resolvase RusA-like endonuclease
MFAREAGVDLTEKLVGVDVVIKKAPAKSWSKKKVAESKKRWYMKSKPDIDNVIKSCLDGLNGVAWRDDDQVASVSASRVIADRDATVITIRLLE